MGYNNVLLNRQNVYIYYLHPTLLRNNKKTMSCLYLTIVRVLVKPFAITITYSANISAFAIRKPNILIWIYSEILFRTYKTALPSSAHDKNYFLLTIFEIAALLYSFVSNEKLIGT